jgi:hypothetical protein
MTKPGAIAALLLSLLIPSAWAGPLRIGLLAGATLARDGVVLKHPGAVMEKAVPRRDEGTVQRERVWTALQAAAERQGWSLEGVVPERIEWSAPMAILENDEPLEAQAISLDPLLHQLRFRLRGATRSNAPWFSAWCPPGVDFAPSRDLGAKNMAAEPSAAVPAAVRAHELLTLYLHSENSFAALQVRTLESGAVGQFVRVRVPLNAHTLRARVVGIDMVEAEF